MHMPFCKTYNTDKVPFCHCLQLDDIPGGSSTPSIKKEELLLLQGMPALDVFLACLVGGCNTTSCD